MQDEATYLKADSENHFQNHFRTAPYFLSRCLTPFVERQKRALPVSRDSQHLDRDAWKISLYPTKRVSAFTLLSPAVPNPVRGGLTLVGKRRAGAVEMTITNLDDEGSGSNADTTKSRRKQRHGELERLRSHTPQPLRRREQVICRRESWDCVTSSIEDNTDAIASTMEWRRMVLQSQKESQATSTHQYREGRSRAKLDAEVQRIRQHYLKQEKILEREIVRLERRYEWTIAQLEREEQDDGSYSVDGWEEVRSDYQPTECDEGSRCGSVVPD